MRKGTYLKKSVPCNDRNFFLTSYFHMRIILPKTFKYASNCLKGSTVQKRIEVDISCGDDALEKKMEVVCDSSFCGKIAIKAKFSISC